MAIKWEATQEKALYWAKKNYSTASKQHVAAFGNSVAYLVTGFSGGSGPSIREHAVSWSLAGDGYNETTSGITIQYPDGRLPRAGEWHFDKACQFAAPICFGELPSISFRIFREENCFDDDPEDLKKINDLSA